MAGAAARGRDTSVNQAELWDRLRQAGVGASLAGNLAPARVVPVADALLAAPIAVVEVILAGSVAATGRVIADLRQRGRQHLLVGAAGVETAAQAAALAASGAHYISPVRHEPAIGAICQQHGALYLPTVITPFAAQAAHLAGAGGLRLFTGGPAGPDYVHTLRQTFAGLALVVAGEFNPVQVAAYARAGATAVLVGGSLVGDADQGMPALIARAREFQQAWAQASGGQADRGRSGRPAEEV